MALWLRTLEVNHALKDHLVFSSFKGKHIFGSGIDQKGMYQLLIAEGVQMTLSGLILLLFLKQHFVDVFSLFSIQAADLGTTITPCFLLILLNNGIPPLPCVKLSVFLLTQGYLFRFFFLAVRVLRFSPAAQFF